METKTDLTKYIVNVQGKDFITFPGLLKEAHAQGLTKIDTKLLNEDLSNPVFKAEVIINDKVFTGYGDANTSNVAKQVSKALIRMAETRAVARALRFGCNIDMAALEELDGDSNVISDSKVSKRKKFSKPSAVEQSNNKVTNGDVVAGNKEEVVPKKSFGRKSFVSKNSSEPEF